MGYGMGFNIMGVHWKIQFGGSQKNQYIEGISLKRGAWTVFRFKKGAWQKRGSCVFEGGWYPNAHYGLGIYQKLVQNLF